jgi:hypothetical protein
MGELANRRNARDLWVSRSHLWAMGAGTLVLGATAFAVGFTVGRDHAPSPEPEIVVADDGELVELLARVEASSRPHGGIETLTFPEALAGEQPKVPEIAVALESAPPEAGEPVVVEPAAMGTAEPVGDAKPAGTFTLELDRVGNADEAVVLRDRLRAAGMEAWIGLEHVGGQAVHRIGIGGFPDEAAAAAKLAEVAPKLQEMKIMHAPAIARIE